MDQPAAVTVLEPDAAPVDSRPQFLDALRTELLQAVDGIVLKSQLLKEDAAHRSAETIEDLRQMLGAASELYDFVKIHLSGDWLGVETPEFAERLKWTRHEIGNRLNHVLGPCQFLIIDEREQHFEQLLDDLESIQRQCRKCEALLPHLKCTAPARRPAGDGTPRGLSADSAGTVQGPPFPLSGGAPLVQAGTILLVDDNRTTCEQLAKFLKKEGHRPITVETGAAALGELATEAVDLILLDFQMPGMSGLDVLRCIKADERLRHVPVIMVSALDSVEDVTPCIELGADDYLTKPVDFALLRARVNSSLERARLREREFGQFFTPEVARYLVRNPELIREGREAHVTVMFCDVRGFSRISERLPPPVMVRWLSDVMGELTQCVLRHSGVLVDYIGDELMAMWGAPAPLDDHAALACAAASDMIRRLPAINERWRAIIDDETDVGIGLNSGVARVGNTGSTFKFKYGPLGNAVNLASRIQGANKYLSTRLLVTGDTLRLIGNQFCARRLCQVRVVNINEPVDLFELQTVDDEQMRAVAARYEVALRHFEQQQFPEAVAVLGELLTGAPHDGPALLLMSRVVAALLHRNDDFDVVWELPGK